jgi:hypothetical protein
VSGSSTCAACPGNSTSVIAATSANDCTCIAGYFRLDATCTACARGTYKAPGTASCTPCPVNSNTQLSASSVRTACTCNIGFLGAPGGTCVNENETAVLLSPAPAPPAAEALAAEALPPSGTPALVKVQLTLPITASEFRAKQASFVDAIAAAAGPSVTSQDVTIKSVTEVSRRLLAARRLLASGVNVEADIATKDAGAVMQGLSKQRLTEALASQGLPAPSSFAVSATAAPAPVAGTSVPQSSQEASAKMPDRTLSVGACFLFFVFCFFGRTVSIGACFH